MEPKRVLIIEDEKNVSRFIQLELQHEGYEPEVVHDGRTGLERAMEEEWDLILLDLMLPGLNGLEICRRIRAVKYTPIIMLTARDGVMDRVAGLESGADDYIPKPFAIEELLARMRALFRRVEELRKGNEEEKRILTFRDLIIDLDGVRVTRNGEEIELTKREYDLLVYLVENRGRVISREQLLNEVWGYEAFIETNVVDVYIRYLRNKLDLPQEESYIQTIRGKGYVMRN
ncbi:response regulator transcription factor [Thermicanus aegyptius]|uniref:response regulator transcription factor n=1 Tax=Thermicanus aegyptius TaxID=94009 RepID=UPI00041DD461|nr:response regulator transcription factor [Thermicanus aegyptius]